MSISQQEASQIAAQLAQNAQMWDIACSFVQGAIGRISGAGLDSVTISLYNDRIEHDMDHMLFNPSLETGEWGKAVDRGYTDDIYAALASEGLEELSDEDIAEVMLSLLTEQVAPAFEGVSSEFEDGSIPYCKAKYLRLRW